MTFQPSICFTAADLRSAALQQGREGEGGVKRREGGSERKAGAQGDDAAKERPWPMLLRTQRGCRCIANKT